MSKWYLISAEDTELIQAGLARVKEACHERSFANTVIDDVLHTLDSGLHTTEEVPEDFRAALEEDGNEAGTSSG